MDTNPEWFSSAIPAFFALAGTLLGYFASFVERRFARKEKLEDEKRAEEKEFLKKRKDLYLHLVYLFYKSESSEPDRKIWNAPFPGLDGGIIEDSYLPLYQEIADQLELCRGEIALYASEEVMKLADNYRNVVNHCLHIARTHTLGKNEENPDLTKFDVNKAVETIRREIHP